MVPLFGGASVEAPEGSLSKFSNSGKDDKVAELPQLTIFGCRVPGGSDQLQGFDPVGDHIDRGHGMR